MAHGILSLVSVLVSILVSSLAAMVGMDGAGAFYTAYRCACLRLDDERWLLGQCSDPVFYSKMRAHSNVCGEVEANARVGAFWMALREATDAFKITWQPGLVGGAVGLVLLLPICWVCAARAAARLAHPEIIPLHEHI